MRQIVGGGHKEGINKEQNRDMSLRVTNEQVNSFVWTSMDSNAVRNGSSAFRFYIHISYLYG